MTSHNAIHNAKCATMPIVHPKWNFTDKCPKLMLISIYGIVSCPNGIDTSALDKEIKPGTSLHIWHCVNCKNGIICTIGIVSLHNWHCADKSHYVGCILPAQLAFFTGRNEIDTPIPNKEMVPEIYLLIWHFT